MSDQPEQQGHGYRDLLRTIDQFFQQTHSLISPIPIRVIEKKDVWILEAELPGVEKEQIQLDIYRQSVRIQVSHKEQIEYKNEQKKIMQEQKHTQIRERIVPLPFLVEEKQVSATYKNGLLRLTIPNKRKKITIE